MASTHSFVTHKLHKGSWLMLLDINRRHLLQTKKTLEDFLFMLFEVGFLGRTTTIIYLERQITQILFSSNYSWKMAYSLKESHSMSSMNVQCNLNVVISRTWMQQSQECG